MSKFCPSCGRINEDIHLYCTYCGDPLDSNLRLMTELKTGQILHPKKHPTYDWPDDDDKDVKSKSHRHDDDEDDEDVAHLSGKQQSSVSTVLVMSILILAGLGIAAYFLL